MGAFLTAAEADDFLGLRNDRASEYNASLLANCKRAQLVVGEANLIAHCVRSNSLSLRASLAALGIVQMNLPSALACTNFRLFPKTALIDSLFDGTKS